MDELNYEMLSFVAAIGTTLGWAIYRAIRWVTLTNAKVEQQEKDLAATEAKVEELQEDFRQLNQVVNTVSVDMTAKNNELVQLLIAAGRHND